MAIKKHPDWPAIATAFAALLFRTVPCTRGALEWAYQYHLRERRRGSRDPLRWAVAFSGGADSLALLLIFWAEGPGRWGRDFTVLHFNHRLRGRAANADEKFARRSAPRSPG